MKKTQKISNLDIINLPLSGKILIEASAGTGKTFSLVILYLRLILGLRENNKICKKLLIQEILVVTFTEHSKLEIKTRIKKYIKHFKKICEKKENNNTIIFKDLLKKIKNPEKAIFILTQAEQSINELAVYTIHEFCYKSLNINKFCSNIFFQNKIIKNEYSLYLKFSNEFWNEYFSRMPKNILQIIIKYFKNPNTLLKNIYPFLSNYNSRKKELSKKPNIVQLYEILVKNIKNFKKQWIDNYKQIFQSIKNSDINKRSYNKSNLSRWMNIIKKWTMEETKNFDFPKELKYFQNSYLTKKTPNGEKPQNKIFQITENFLKTKFSLKSSFLIESILHIKKKFNKEKKIQGTFEFEDLIQFLYQALYKKNENISKIIKKKYPVLLIDEFQDTNYQQYKIFEKIYALEKDLFILIGDPKQAIYEFQGANISSYIKIKKNIKQLYQLKINWRSSKEMVDSVNLLFSRSKNPFLSPDIKFISTKSIYKEKKIIFKVNKKIQPAMRFFLNKDIKITQNDYINWIINVFRNYISLWINEGKNGNAVIQKNKNRKNISLKDICILVNNKREAYVMQNALNKVNIPSEYFSKRESVFHSHDALELLWIFQAILNPTNEYTLKKAISTNIINKSFEDIDSITKKHVFWSNLINIFNNYLLIWNKFGIICVIREIIIKFKTKEKNNFFTENSPNLKKILYIGELLEIRFEKIKKKHLLILWFKRKIKEKNDIPDTDYIPLNHDKNQIKIVTIHKSKGLEYPIVLIPFFIISKKYEKNTLRINNNNKSYIIEERKELSKNMRLLYVALTRAIVHCCIGIALIKNERKTTKNYYLNSYKNALDYIIKLKRKNYDDNLYEILSKIHYNNKNIEVTCQLPNFHNSHVKIQKKYTKPKNKKFTRILEYNCNITSYSQLKKKYNNQKLFRKNYDSIFSNIDIQKKHKNITEITTPYNFPKGKIFGIFMHEIFKEINFHENIHTQWILQKLKQHKFDKKLSKPLKNWIYTILNASLNKNNLSLSQLNPKNYVKELNFFLSIKNKLTEKKINKIINLSNISLQSPYKISINPIKGILNGSIDLVFKWKTKYYLIDYKSTHLGHKKSDYTEEKIKRSIKRNYYDLQYQLYSIALHKYLMQRIKNYSFHKHFGGIYILFLRAIDNKNQNSGIFFTIPNLTTIQKLNNIF
ncbi:MAG: exodeoxyribonuclease V subunit beta [Buchnera aphidicola (Nurudea yanoniella)]